MDSIWKLALGWLLAAATTAFGVARVIAYDARSALPVRRGERSAFVQAGRRRALTFALPVAAAAAAMFVILPASVQRDTVPAPLRADVSHVPDIALFAAAEASPQRSEQLRARSRASHQAAVRSARSVLVVSAAKRSATRRAPGPRAVQSRSRRSRAQRTSPQPQSPAVTASAPGRSTTATHTTSVAASSPAPAPAAPPASDAPPQDKPQGRPSDSGPPPHAQNEHGNGNGQGRGNGQANGHGQGNANAQGNANGQGNGNGNGNGQGNGKG